MTNRKTTKRALFTSTLALLMCVAMLIGTTFAWFTDTASTSVNKVQAGKLDVALEMLDGTNWVSAEGKTLNFVKAGGADDEAILWEPGCTYELPALRVCNEGNLALKYSIQITGINGDAKLNEAIEWTVTYPNGEVSQHNDGIALTSVELEEKSNSIMMLLANAASSNIIISGHMKEDAGNEYQGLSIDGIAVTVYATQAASEYDSFTNTYDENAPLASYWDGTVVAPAPTGDVYHITNAAEFAWLMENTQGTNSPFRGKTFVLDCDIDFGGATISGVGSLYCNILFTFDGNGHTIRNFKIDASGREFYAGLFNQFGGTVKNLTVENATVIGQNMVGVIASNVESAGATVENCHVKDSTVIATSKKAGAITGYLANGSVTGCTATNVDVYCADPDNTQSSELYGYIAAGTTYDAVNTATNAVNVNVYRGEAASDVNVIANGVILKGSTYEISSAAGLSWFANQVNVNRDNFSGKTIKLTADINLAGVAWTPVANDGATLFYGTFDGNGKTISNLTVTDSRTNADDETAARVKGVGFFGWLDGDVKNVTFANANVSGYHNVGVLAGYQQHGQINNVTVKNSTVTGTHIGENLCGDKIGGIVGVSYNVNHNDATDTYVDMINCKIENSTVKGGRDIGSIAGAAPTVDSTKFSGCTATNVTLGTTSGCTATSTYVGACLEGLVGRDI